MSGGGEQKKQAPKNVAVYVRYKKTEYPNHDQEFRVKVSQNPDFDGFCDAVAGAISGWGSYKNAGGQVIQGGDVSLFEYKQDGSRGEVPVKAKDFKSDAEELFALIAKPEKKQDVQQSRDEKHAPIQVHCIRGPTAKCSASDFAKEHASAGGKYYEAYQLLDTSTFFTTTSLFLDTKEWCGAVQGASAERIECLDNALKRATLDCANLDDVSETMGDYSVQQVHQGGLESALLPKGALKTSKVKMHAVGCGFGRASRNSEPDGRLYGSVVIKENAGDRIVMALRGIWEVKGTWFSLGGVWRQAVAYASNVAFALFRLGVSAEHVLVPVVVSNGRLIQFGCMRLLYPCYPHLTIVSDVLDLLSSGGRRVAAQHWCAVEALLCAELKAEPCPSDEIDANIDSLDTDRYYLKSIDSNFFCVLDDVDLSLMRMKYLLEMLYESETARKYVVFPLGMTCHFHEEKDKQHEPLLVFENLSAAGFRIGMPEDSQLCGKIIDALRIAVTAVHRAGVVHIDLYPSNFMWREHEGKVELKIIDWDACHATNEILRPKVKRNLENGNRLLLSRTDGKVAYVELDDCLVELLSRHIDDAALKTEDKKKLDTRFFELCENAVRVQNLSLPFGQMRI